LASGTYSCWIRSAVGSKRDDGITLPGNGAFVAGSRGLIAESEKSPARSRAVGMMAELR
jgi:hypothetical protein